MQRVKSFESTGLAPNGRWYAGDANAIQDAAAGLTDFLQTISLGALRIGEAGLQLLRFGSGEARLTGAFRADGIIFGAKGLLPRGYTTAERDALPAADKPQGLIIWNATILRHEVNRGSGTSPLWHKVGDTEVGSVIEWPYSESSLGAEYQMADGGAISRTAFPAYHAVVAAAGYPHGNGDGFSTFNKPDERGRVAVGRDNMGGTPANRISVANQGQTLGGVNGAQSVTLSITEMPVHLHVVSSHSHGGATGGFSLNHTHGFVGTTSGHSVSHAHGPDTAQFALTNAVAQVASGTDFAAVNGWSGITGGANADHTHTYSGTTAGVSNDHTHTIAAESPNTNTQGGGGAHLNLQPGIIVNKMVRVS